MKKHLCGTMKSEHRYLLTFKNKCRVMSEQCTCIFFPQSGKVAKLETIYRYLERYLIWHAFISFSLPSFPSNSLVFNQRNEKFFAFFTDKTAHRGVILTDISVNYHMYVVYIFKHFLYLATDSSPITSYTANIGFLK